MEVTMLNYNYLELYLANLEVLTPYWVDIGLREESLTCGGGSVKV